MNRQRRRIIEDTASLMRAIQHTLMDEWPKNSDGKRTSIEWTQADVLICEAVMRHKIRFLDLMEDVSAQQFDDLFDAAHRDGDI